MKKFIPLLLLISTNSYAMMATWTGKQVQIQTVSYQYAWKCEYRLPNGQTFWEIFKYSCASSIDVY